MLTIGLLPAFVSTRGIGFYTDKFFKPCVNNVGNIKILDKLLIVYKSYWIYFP